MFAEGVKFRSFNAGCAHEILLPGGKRVLIDPFFQDSLSGGHTLEEVEGADYVLVTHTHFDHELDLGYFAERYRPLIFVGALSAQALVRYHRLAYDHVVPVYPGQTYTVEDFKLEIIAAKERCCKIITIDSRRTKTAELADIHLMPRIGTDAAIAHAMAKVLIEEGLYDKDFVEKYCYGFEKYADYVKGFSLQKAEDISGVPAADIRRAVDMFMETDPATIIPGNGLTHRINGYNVHRSILSLLALTGRFDRPGTIMPEHETICHSDAGFDSLEEEFYLSRKPEGTKPAIGTERFPMWAHYMNEAQGMDRARAEAEAFSANARGKGD